MPRIYSKELRYNKDYLLYNKTLVKYIPQSLRCDKEFMLKMMRINGTNLMYLNNLRNDLDIIRAALNQNGLSIRYVHRNVLRENSDLYELAFRSNRESIQYFGRIKDKSKFMLDHHDIEPMLNKGIMCFDYIRDRHLTTDIMLKIVKIYDRLPKLNRVECLNNIDLSNPKHMELAKAISVKFGLGAKCIRNHIDLYKNKKENDSKIKELTAYAVQENQLNAIYIDDEFLSDKEFVLEIYKNRSYYMDYVINDKLSHDMLHDRDVALIRCFVCPCHITTTPEYQNDREFIIEYIKGYDIMHYPSYCVILNLYVSDEIKSDREISLLAISRQPGSMRSDMSGLKDDIEYVKGLLTEHPDLCPSILIGGKSMDSEDIADILFNGPNALYVYQYISHRLRCEYKYIKLYSEYTNIPSSHLTCVPKECKYDINVMKLFVFKDTPYPGRWAFNWFSKEVYDEMYESLANMDQNTEYVEIYENVKKYVEINMYHNVKSARK